MTKHRHDVLAVNYNGLDLATTDLVNEAKALEGALRAIEGAVANAAQGWDGEAHRAYVRLQKAWDDEARHIHEAIMAITKVVGSAGGDYMGGDKKAASYYL